MRSFASSVLFETQRSENKGTWNNSGCFLSLHLIPLKLSDGIRKGEEPALNENVDSKAQLNPSSLQMSAHLKRTESSHVTHSIRGSGFPLPTNKSFTISERAESAGARAELLAHFHLARPCEHLGWLAFCNEVIFNEASCEFNRYLKTASL